MDTEQIRSKILHLREVEKLSARQISEVTGINRKRIARIIRSEGALPMKIEKDSMLEPYRNLIAQWYKEYPRLKAKQIYERINSYGYVGSYASVVRFSRQYRQVKTTAYHVLSFLPAEEAQIDWFFFKHETLGTVAGFLYVLAYSRYAWGKFYLKSGFEFFLDGHLQCFNHLKGLARRHRYDNLKSVVLKREPVIQYNPQFLDFARFFGFSIHLCNPYKGNEKGRVERLIRDIRVFLYAETFTDLADLNHKFQSWLGVRNNQIHRATGKTPKFMLEEERLLSLPQIPYLPSRTIPVLVSKTNRCEFETNKYSVPDTCSGKTGQLIAYPEKIEIFVRGQRVATHSRCFGEKQEIVNPLHSETLLKRTPNFKMQRILQLMRKMHAEFNCFIERQETEEEKIQAAYQLFLLLKNHSRYTLYSAVGELNQTGCFKIKALFSKLSLPQPKDAAPVWPQNELLLNLNYENRRLEDYDELSRIVENP